MAQKQLQSDYSYPRPFSHSSLSVFDKCPAQFRFYYLERIEKPQESIEAYLGKRVHEALEFLYRKVMDGHIPSFDMLVEYFHDLWEAGWHNQVVFVNQHLPRSEYQQTGEKCLAWYYRKYFPFDEPVVSVEEELVFNLDEDDNYPIKGVLDRVQHDGNGKWGIHDYKTSKRRMSQAAADKDRQLALYQLGLQQLKDHVEDVRLVWHFVRTGDTVESKRNETQLKELIRETKNKIDIIRQTISRGGPFQAIETPLCNWCYYWEECQIKNTNNPFVQ
ncbi:MAG: RecB family exonuclease [Fidelibacterota bacterium]